MAEALIMTPSVVKAEIMADASEHGPPPAPPAAADPETSPSAGPSAAGDVDGAAAAQGPPAVRASPSIGVIALVPRAGDMLRFLEEYDRLAALRLAPRLTEPAAAARAVRRYRLYFSSRFVHPPPAPAEPAARPGSPSPAPAADGPAMPPPPDVAFVWLTRLLQPSRYRADCLGPSGPGRLVTPGPELLAAAAAFTDAEAAVRAAFHWRALCATVPPPPGPFIAQSLPPAFAVEDEPFFFDPEADGRREAADPPPAGDAHLAAAVARQAAFLASLRDRKVPYKSLPFLRRAAVRYARFIRLAAKHPDKILVPSKDIDIIWHTHQLRPAEYAAACDALLGRLFDHDDSIPKPALAAALLETSLLWEEAYGVPYLTPPHPAGAQPRGARGVPAGSGMRGPPRPAEAGDGSPRGYLRAWGLGLGRWPWGSPLRRSASFSSRLADHIRAALPAAPARSAVAPAPYFPEPPVPAVVFVSGPSPISPGAVGERAPAPPPPAEDSVRPRVSVESAPEHGRPSTELPLAEARAAAAALAAPRGAAPGEAAPTYELERTERFRGAVMAVWQRRAEAQELATKLGFSATLYPRVHARLVDMAGLDVTSRPPPSGANRSAFLVRLADEMNLAAGRRQAGAGGEASWAPPLAGIPVVPAHSAVSLPRNSASYSAYRLLGLPPESAAAASANVLLRLAAFCCIFISIGIGIGLPDHYEGAGFSGSRIRWEMLAAGSIPMWVAFCCHDPDVYPFFVLRPDTATEREMRLRAAPLHATRLLVLLLGFGAYGAAIALAAASWGAVAINVQFLGNIIVWVACFDVTLRPEWIDARGQVQRAPRELISYWIRPCYGIGQCGLIHMIWSAVNIGRLGGHIESPWSKGFLAMLVASLVLMLLMAIVTDALEKRQKALLISLTLALRAWGQARAEGRERDGFEEAFDKLACANAVVCTNGAWSLGPCFGSGPLVLGPPAFVAAALLLDSVSASNSLMPGLGDAASTLARAEAGGGSGGGSGGDGGGGGGDGGGGGCGGGGGGCGGGGCGGGCGG